MDLAKSMNFFFGQGWYSTLEGFAGLMGIRNVRASLSPLHSEVETLIWAIEYMKNLRQFHVTFATDCFQLMKMVSGTRRIISFYNLLGGY